MNTSPLIAPAAQNSAGGSINNCLENSAETLQISALVPVQIQVERIQSVGAGKVPQIVYKTSKGRCSTLLSKDEFLKIWQCWLQIRHPNLGEIKAWEIKTSGLQFITSRGHFLLGFSEALAFLSRYNRVGIEPLSVKLNGKEALVWNPVHQTISQVNQTGCSCADSLYRQTVCKHQIAVHLCRTNEL